MLRDLLYRLRALLFRDRREAELDEELRNHLEMEAAKYRNSGMSAAEAERLAHLRLGGGQQIREECRDARGTRFVEDFLRDIRHGLRSLRRSPAFTTTAAGSLALAIGATTAIFGVADALILKPLPFREPDRLVMIWETMPQRNVRHNVVSPGNLIDWGRRSTSFEQITGFDSAVSNLSGIGSPREIHGLFATRELFSVLGTAPSIGRNYTEDEARQSAHVLVISDRFARLQFGAPAAALGSKVILDQEPWQIIGVMPRDFEFLDAESDFWRPYWLNPAIDYRRSQGRFMRAIARLKPGVDFRRADREVRQIARRLEADYPDFDKGWGVELTPYREEVSGGYRTPLYLLMGAVGLVLLIACVNVANLLMARSGVRRRELGIRTSLGAGRARLTRQLTTESAVLALLGTVPGCLLAFGALRIFRGLAPPTVHGLASVGVDLRMLLFAGVIAFTATLLFGVAPAIISARAAPAAALHEGGRAGGSTARGGRFAGSLVALEFALAVILVMGAGLLIRSFILLRSVDTGFVPEHVLTARLLLPRAYDPPRTRAFFEELQQKVTSIPGVTAASAVTFLPFGGIRPGTAYSIDGRPAPPPDQRPVTDVRAVQPGYFHTLGIPLLRGRDFSFQEGSPERPAFIINQALARAGWGSDDPIGKVMTVKMTREPMPGVIVGVVADTRDRKLGDAAEPTVYYSHASFPIGYMSVVVRSPIAESALGRSVTEAVHSLDPNQPVVDIRTLDALLDESVSPRRFQALLLGTFAGIALLLAAVGIYGVSSYAVTQRTNEIGIRIALGARRSQVMALIARQSAGVVGIGLMAGILGALALRKVITSFLYGVAATDPATFAAGTGVLLVISLIAILGPVRRAAGIDPIKAVRAE